MLKVTFFVRLRLIRSTDTQKFRTNYRSCIIHERITEMSSLIEK